MELGLGIFLGSVFFGTVLLYLKTRDRWNWRRIAKRVAMATICFVAVAALSIGGYIGYEKWQGRPQLVTSLEGISIGEKLADVVFKHGTFKKADESEGDGSERFTSEEKRLTIFVRSGAIESVVYICREASDYRSVSAISCASSGDEIFSRFGKQVRVQCATKKDVDDEFRRVYDVPEFGIRFLMWRNTVAGFFVSDSRHLATLVGKSWGPCS